MRWFEELPRRTKTVLRAWMWGFAIAICLASAIGITTLGRATWLMIILGMAAMALSRAAAGKLIYYIQLAGLQREVAPSVVTKAIEEIVAEGKIFALYLRSHSLERGALLKPVLPDPDGPGEGRMIFLPELNNSLEESVVEPIQKLMPVLALANPDESVPTSAMRVPVMGDWWATFLQLAPKAAVIVVVVERYTTNISRELTWINKNEAANRLLLIVRSAEADTIRSDFPGLSAQCACLITVNERRAAGTIRLERITLPQEFTSFLQGLARSEPAASD